MPEIKLKFDLRSGETKIETQGFRGKSCKDATEFLEKTLGQCSDFQKKSEWYEENIIRTGQVVSNLCG